MSGVRQANGTSRDVGASGHDGAKRRQILEGARTVFRAQGFDGASMETIARTAHVSKGTLYVYFDSKAALFEALIIADRHGQAEALVDTGSGDTDIATDLRRIGHTFVDRTTDPDRVATVRMVIGAAEKFPQFGRLLYEAGPVCGAKRLGAYLQTRVNAGDLAPCDTERAAAQFFDLCAGRMLKRVLFGVSAKPDQDEITEAVDRAVEVFLAAYRAKPA